MTARGLRCSSGGGGWEGWGGFHIASRGHSGCRRLARGPAHGRGAVGAGALPHGRSERQLQLLEEGRPRDLSRLGTLAGAPRQHAAHHAELHTGREGQRGHANAVRPICFTYSLFDFVYMKNVYEILFHTNTNTHTHTAEHLKIAHS